MAGKKFKNHDERVSFVDKFISGAKDEQLKTFMEKEKDRLAELEKFFQEYKIENDKQESLKAQLNKQTAKVDEASDKVDTLYTALVDSAYSIFGKKSPLLKSIGLKPWKTPAKKSSKKE